MIRILLIEDNAHDAVMVRNELDHAGGSGYEVTHVEELSEALQLLQTTGFDVVLTDLGLPDSDGLETCERLRSVAEDVPIIALTGLDDDVAVKALRAGAQAYLLKGRLDGEMLVRSINQSIERQGFQRELAKSRANLAAAQHIARMGSWELDLANLDDMDQNPLYWSDEVFRIFGYQPGGVSVSNEVFFNAVHHADRGRIQKALKKSIEDRQPYDLVHRIVLPDGEERTVREQSEIIYDKVSGQPLKMVGTVQDITQSSRAEEALRHSEERFRQLAENINEVFWMTDPRRDQMLYVSPAYETIWGRSCDSLYAEPHTWEEAIHPEDRERVLQAALSHQADGTYDEQFRIVRPDNSVRWIRDRAFPVRDQAGRIYRIVGVAEDISERRLSDEALKMQGRVLESMIEGVTVCDERGEILFSNSACNTMFGYEHGEITGKHMSVLNNLASEESRQFEQDLMAHLQSKGFWTGELNSRKKDGSAFITRSRISVLEIAGARSFVAVIEDVTEKKSMESQFLRSQRMESVGRLSSGIAHDLNNILTPILMSVFMLRRPLSPEEFEKMLGMIETSAQRGADLIKQLLSLGRDTGGQRKVVQPRALIHDMGKIIRGTFPKDITLSAETPDDGWPVIGDATQLHQVLLNLCVNARDAMPNGGTLSLTVTNMRLDESYAAMNTEAKPGPYVLIRVTDTGEGMAPEIMDKVFDPFFTTKTAGKGTGLGLSTVMSIVKGHDGFLNLRSRVGGGSTFEIHLPAAPGAKEASVAVPSAALPRGDGELILVVDDEAGIRDIVQKMLVRHGYRVLSAGDGTEAVAQYSQHREEIKLVLTDIMMPFMDGVTLARTLKRMDPLVKIVASSGIGSVKGKKEKTAELRSLGVNAFLTKPYSASEFLKVIHGSLQEAPHTAH